MAVGMPKDKALSDRHTFESEAGPAPEVAETPDGTMLHANDVVTGTLPCGKQLTGRVTGYDIRSDAIRMVVTECDTSDAPDWVTNPEGEFTTVSMRLMDRFEKVAGGRDVLVTVDATPRNESGTPAEARSD